MVVVALMFFVVHLAVGCGLFGSGRGCLLDGLTGAVAIGR